MSFRLADDWSALADQGWRHDLAVPGAELLSAVEGLECGAGPSGPERYTWAEERIYRTAGGGYLFARLTRTQGEERDGVAVLAGIDPGALVTAVKVQLGMPPGRVETFGRAGIEIGLLPDDEIEGDELDGPIPD